MKKFLTLLFVLCFVQCLSVAHVLGGNGDPVLEGKTATGNIVTSGSVVAGTATVGSGSITDSSGAISFGNENISTTGTAAAGAVTTNGVLTVKPDGTNEVFQVNDGSLDFTDGNAGTTGTLTVDASGNWSYNKQVTINKSDPAIVFDPATATDTEFWVGVTEDAGGDDNDKFQIGDGTSPGTNPFVTVDTSGKVGIGTASPATIFAVNQAASSTVIGHTSTQAANTVNEIRLLHSANTSTQSRGVFEINSSFSNITDAARNSLVQFKTANAGTYGTAMTINGGNVGIGTTVPTEKLTIVPGADWNTINIGADSADVYMAYNAKELADTWSSVNSSYHGLSYKGRITASDATTQHQFSFVDKTTGTETTPMIIAKDGNVGIGVTDPDAKLEVVGNVHATTGNFKVDSGYGIDFSATSDAAGMSSELLDDYEEGTWTPVLTSSTPPTTPYTMDVTFATYTIVGRKVTLLAAIQTDSVDTTGASGQLTITGAPVAAANYGMAHIPYSSAFVGDHPSGGYIHGSTIYLTYRDAADGASSLCNPADLTTGVTADRNQMYIIVVYFV